MSAGQWAALTVVVVAVGIALAAAWWAVAADRARSDAARAARASRAEAAATAAAAAAAATVARSERDAAWRVLADERAAAAGRDRAWRDDLLNVEREWQDSAAEWHRIVESQDRRLAAHHRRRRPADRALATIDVDPAHLVDVVDVADAVDVPTESWALPSGPYRAAAVAPGGEG